MRGMRRMWGAVVIAVLAGMGTTRDVSAQETRSLQSVHVGDLQGMKSKFVGLARAFPESAYDWRPMEGVRSVKEVLALMVAEESARRGPDSVPSALRTVIETAVRLAREAVENG